MKPRSPKSKKTNVTKRRVAAAVVVAVVIIVAIIVVIMTCGGDEGSMAQKGATSTTRTTLRELTESAAATNLDSLSKATLVSIYLPSATGRPTSYGLSPKLAPVKNLIDAMKAAKETSTGTSVSSTTTATSSGKYSSQPAITFVLKDRTTMTFTLDLDNGQFSRNGKTWKVNGDLKALITAATKR